MRVGRRVRIRRADFDALIEASGMGRSEAQPAAPSICYGQIPLPQVPVD